MTLLTELVVYGMFIIVYIFCSPIIFGVLQAVGLGGPEGFFATLVPWVGLLTMIGRVLYLIRYGTSEGSQ